jgi:hypothetical protein
LFPWGQNLALNKESGLGTQRRPLLECIFGISAASVDKTIATEAGYFSESLQVLDASLGFTLCFDAWALQTRQ